MALSVCNTVIDENGIEILEHGSLPFPAACYYNDVFIKPVPAHWHEEFEVVLVTEGTAAFSFGRKKVERTQGQGIFLNSGTLHSVVSADEKNCFIKSICFHPRLVGGREDSIFWQKYIKGLLTERVSGYFLFEDLSGFGAEAVLYFSDAWEKGVKEPDGFEFDLRNDVSKLLFLFAQKQKKEGVRLSNKEIRDETRIKQMMGYVKEHFAESVTIDQIADASLVSVSECLRCFNLMLGITPIRYLRKVRLERAAGLLQAGKSVSESSIQSGFDDMSYFAREFKKQYGVAPSEYKKNKKKLAIYQ